MRRRWGRAPVFAVIVAVAVASGFLNPGQTAGAGPAVSLRLTAFPVALEWRDDGFVIEINV